MNASVRRLINSVPVLKGMYQQARFAYNGRRMVRAARPVFKNIEDYRRALLEERPGQFLDLCTYDGLRFTVRQNCRDAGILAEVFLDFEYSRWFDLPPNPVVVDVGGYIGDFAIFAATRLGAAKVITVEPSLQNFALLEANIRNNNCMDRVIALRKAVTNGQPARLNIDAAEAGQMRVSAYYGDGHGELKEVPGISLAEIVKQYQLPRIDLLKIDCEGGEYMIISTVPAEVLRATQNIIFEYHEIDNFSALLAQVKQRLTAEGFSVETCGRGGNLITAIRRPDA